MWVIVTSLCVVLLVPTAALGKSLYVKENTSEALLRSGPSLSNKILTILKPGQEVSLEGEEGDYYVVATRGGTQGYVLKYLLTDQSPAEVRLRELEQRSQQRINELEVRTEEQAKELAALREERIQLEAAKTGAEEKAGQQTDLIAQLQAQQSLQEREESLQWFVAGAGVLLIGVILGRLWGAAGRRARRNGGLSLGGRF
jgi:SH3 domain protein